MAKSKDLEEVDRKRAEGSAAEACDNAISDAKPDHARSEAYEACMQAYRWLSRRYRKALDALAK